VNVFPSQKGHTFNFISFFFGKHNLFILFIFFSMIPARKNHRKNEKNEKKIKLQVLPNA